MPVGTGCVLKDFYVGQEVVIRHIFTEPDEYGYFDDNITIELDGAVGIVHSITEDSDYPIRVINIDAPYPNMHIYEDLYRPYEIEPAKPKQPNWEV